MDKINFLVGIAFGGVVMFSILGAVIYRELSDQIYRSKEELLDEIRKLKA